jgi:hypothetical protein
MADQLVKKGPGKKREGYRGKKRKWWKPTGIGTGTMIGTDFILDPSPYMQFFQALAGGKDGGRVTPKGIGKAKRGFGRAMRKK